MRRDTLKRLFAVLTGEHVTNTRYAQLLREFSEGKDAPVEKNAVILVNEIGIVYLSGGVVYDEEVSA